MDQSIALPPSTGWFPMLHQIVDSGVLARMHPSAPALYIAIKRYSDFNTGFAEVSNKRLYEAIGVSKPKFKKARASLQENGIISIIGKNYQTRYIIHEHLCHYTADRTPIASSIFQYIPSKMMNMLKVLKSQSLTADQIGTTLTIDTVNIQINNFVGPGPVDKE
jgi:hypothetical protein